MGATPAPLFSKIYIDTMPMPKSQVSNIFSTVAVSLHLAKVQMLMLETCNSLWTGFTKTSFVMGSSPGKLGTYNRSPFLTVYGHIWIILSNPSHSHQWIPLDQVDGRMSTSRQSASIIFKAAEELKTVVPKLAIFSRLADKFTVRLAGDVPPIMQLPGTLLWFLVDIYSHLSLTSTLLHIIHHRPYCLLLWLHFRNAIST